LVSPKYKHFAIVVGVCALIALVIFSCMVCSTRQTCYFWTPEKTIADRQVYEFCTSYMSQHSP
jgi:hypothetical protein